MIVGHCHSHSSHIHGQGHQNNNYHHRHHHPHRHTRSGSDSSREENEQYSSGGSSSNNNNNNGGGGDGGGGNSESSGNTTTTSSSSSDYSLAISSEMGDRSLHRHPSTASLLDSIERRTQRTYRYGIGLVCVGATLNWLGFAQGTNYIDPLRYLGVACVLTGSFCVCLAMCRWLSKPISVSGHHVTNLEEERSNGDVHVINVAVPMYVPNLHEEYRPTKPPDYEQIVGVEEAFPPPYDEAVKLRPSDFFGASTPPPPSLHHHHHQPSGVIMDAATAGEGGGNSMYISQFTHSSCQPSPSQNNHHDNHSTLHHHHHQDLSRALLLDHQDTDSLIGINRSGAPTPTPQPTPRHTIITQHQPHLIQHYLSGRNSISSAAAGDDPPPAYEPSPRPSISSCSSSAPLIPTSTSRFDLPPSFSVRRIFGGGGGSGGVSDLVTSTSSSPRDSPMRRRESVGGSNSNANNNNNSNLHSGNISEYLHDQVINEDATLALVVHQQLGNSDSLNSNVVINNL